MENITILIIEDEPTINRIVSNYFLKEKFTVLSALDGFKGLQLFSQNKVDLVCLDIMMPNVNGWDVAKTIREIRAHSDRRQAACFFRNRSGANF